jgi:pentatricopeptide repeat protein
MATLRCSSIVTLALACFVLLSGTACSKESRRVRYLEAADKHFAAGDYGKAEIEYLNALRLGGKPDGHIIGRLGTMYYEQGELLRAFASLSQARQLSPTNLDVQSKLAILYVAGGRYTNAQQEALEVLSKNPTNEDALLVLADAAVRPEDIASTEQRLVELQSLAGKSPGYHLAWGSLRLRQQDLAGAAAAYNQAYALDPKSSAVNAALGRFYLRQNDTNKAEQAFRVASENAPQRSSRRLLYADFKLQTGAIEEAKKQLEAISKDVPDFLPAQLLQARIAFGERRLDDALKLVGGIVARDNLNFEARILNGQVLLAKGDFAKAVKDLEQATTQFDRSGQLHYQLALAHLLNRDLPRSTLSLQQAIQLEPNLVEAQLLFAELNLRSGKAPEVITSMRRLTELKSPPPRAFVLLADAYAQQGLLDEALTVYRRMSESFPRETQPLFAQAGLLLQRSRTNDAMTVYRRISELDPKDGRPYYSQGVVYLDQNNLGAARLAFEQALTVATNYLAAFSQLVGLDVREKNFAAAQQRAQEWIAWYPKEAEPLITLARVYSAQGNTNKTEETLLQAVEVEPDQPNAHNLLASLYVSQGKLTQALERFEQLAAKNPSNIVALAQIGMIYSSQEKHDKARDAYEQLLKVNPQSPLALNNLAYLYSEKLGRLDRAYELANQAYEVATRGMETASRARGRGDAEQAAGQFKAVAADTLGWILFRQGDYARALGLISEAAQRLGRNPEVLHHLGMAYYMMGDGVRAQEALAQALALAANADFPGKAEAEQRLAVLQLDAASGKADMLVQLEKQVKDQPQDLIALLKLGGLYEGSGQMGKALKAYEDALRINPNSTTIILSVARLQAADPAARIKALETARRARTLTPDDPRVAHAVGRLAFELAARPDDFTWAHALLAEAVRANPTNAIVLADFARSAYSLGRLPDAEDALGRAARADPAYAQASGVRAFVEMVAAGKSVTAAQAAAGRIQETLNREPNDVPALMAAGLIYESRAQFKDAQQVYERALARYPLFTPATARLAIAYGELGTEDAKAYPMAQRAREVYPNDVEVAKALGKLAYRRNDMAYAARLLQEALRVRVNDADVMYHLALAQLGQKQEQAAKELFGRALQADPSHRLAGEAKKALAELK